MKDWLRVRGEKGIAYIRCSDVSAIAINDGEIVIDYRPTSMNVVSYKFRGDIDLVTFAEVIDETAQRSAPQTLEVEK